MTVRRSISGVTAMLGDAAVCAISRTQRCVTLSTTEAEYEAMAEGVKEGLFVRPVLYFMQPGVTFPIKPFEDNEKPIAVADNLLRFGKSKDIDMRWKFIRGVVKTKVVTVTHVKLGRQCADTITKALFRLLKGTGRDSRI